MICDPFGPVFGRGSVRLYDGILRGIRHLRLGVAPRYLWRRAGCSPSSDHWRCTANPLESTRMASEVLVRKLDLLELGWPKTLLLT